MALFHMDVGHFNTTSGWYREIYHSMPLAGEYIAVYPNGIHDFAILMYSDEPRGVPDEVCITLEWKITCYVFEDSGFISTRGMVRNKVGKREDEYGSDFLIHELRVVPIDPAMWRVVLDTAGVSPFNSRAFIEAEVKRDGIVRPFFMD